jgi:EmrB/QacA subfamily drug resistance transporter
MTAAVGGRSRNLVLAGMIFAVAMTFIDQTIVSIAAPDIQRELGLTQAGVQWAINAYLIALASFFAFGGRLADTLGHRRMCVLGVVIFAGASAMCGLTPTGSAAQTWIISFRFVQGIGGALMFPAALGIVVQTFDFAERGRALALFFGIAGGLTAIGPVLGGYLTEWTWRAIFWVNLPVAAVALVLIAIAKPTTEYKWARIDVPGLLLIVGGVGLSVLGFQQSSVWGWDDPATYACIAVGALLLVAFVLVERRTAEPLMQVRIFLIRPFAVENLVLGIAMLAFVPLFFFGSEYAQISLGKNAQSAGVYLLFFFLGFVVASQIGGRVLDRRGAKRPVVLGCAIAAVGFALLAARVTQLDFSTQQWFIVLAGFGMGLMLTPASTDAVNRASRLSYGEATGITQTVRNYSASLGFAVLGTILIDQLHTRLYNSILASHGTPAEATSFVNRFGGSSSGPVSAIPHFVRLDFAYATRTVFYVMAGVMAVASIVALVGLRDGVQERVPEASEGGVPEASGAPVAPPRTAGA